MGLRETSVAKGNERQVHSRWDAVERKWLLRNEMPAGTRLALERRSDNRKIRGDLVVHHRRLPPAAPSSSTVKDALDALQGALITDIHARGLRVRLYAPDGSHANGNTKVGNVKALPPSEKARHVDRDSEVDVAADTAGQYVEALDDACVADDVAPKAFLRALVARYGADDVRSWLNREGRRAA